MKCACGCGGETNVSKWTNTARGWVKGQPVKYLLGHRSKPKFRDLIKGRIDVRGEDECWPWTGLVDSHGYGRISRGRVPRLILAEKLGRDLRPGEIVRHTCDNRPCCNPNHLIPGTNADNTRDAKERGRLARGERHGQAKLTRDQVETIRSLRAAGGRPVDIAALFGISPSTVRDIATGRSWAA